MNNQETIFGIDFDETLNLENKKFKPNVKLIQFLKNSPNLIFYIVTARNDTDSNRRYINEFCKEYNLFPENIFFTNQALKGDLLKKLNVKYFIDDNEEQLASAMNNDIQSFHPNDLYSFLKEFREEGLNNLNKLAKKKSGEVVKNYRVLMKKDLNLSSVFLDNPIGSKKKFGAKNYKKLPFDYGEFSDYINPADDMGWDVIIVPSESGGKKTQQDHSYKIIGIVKINPNKAEWKEKGEGIKEPPLGNDKLIISTKSSISKEDKNIIEEFFKKLWQFKKPIYFI